MIPRAAWEAATGPIITPDDVEAGSHAAEVAMMTEFFGPVLDELSPPERRFLRAMADVGANPTFALMSRRLGDTDRFDRSRSSLAQIRDALLDRRVIYQVGDTLHYALPYFERYVRATA